MIIEWLEHGLMMLGMNRDSAFTISYILTSSGVFFLSWLSYYISRKYIEFISVRFLLKSSSKWVNAVVQRKLLYRLAYVTPALVIYAAIPLLALPQVPFTVYFLKIVRTIIIVYMIFIINSMLVSFINLVADMYEILGYAKRRPIKSYLQVLTLFFYVIAGVLAISVILNKSPLVFFTGLGAMMAVILVTFKEPIMGLVASIQNTQADIIHMGDWIEVPQYGVDGYVVDMSLNTIKVQNFDKTIVTLPAQAMLEGGIKNWRGMEESGGRRIKRSIFIDVRSIKFCTTEFLKKFKTLPYLSDFIVQHHGHDTLTNVGIFRAYLETYLKKNEHVNQNFTILVRYLEFTEKGLPLEVYAFLNNTDFVTYESYQAYILEHIFAVMSEFDLKVCQVCAA